MFDSIPECTSWQCINSFALWVSALGTVLISTASLYISHQAFSYTRKRDIPSINAKITAGIISDPIRPLDFLGLDVVNTGHRKVVITGYSWEFKESFRKGMQLISYIANNEYKSFSTAIPCQLDEGEKAQFFNPLNLFVRSPEFYQGATYLGVWYRVHTLKVRVSCSTFEKVIKVDKGIRSLIWHQYKELMGKS